MFQALGLIGLTEGHPVRYHPQTDRVEPARGDPVEIEVRYQVGPRGGHNTTGWAGGALKHNLQVTSFG